MVCFSQTGAADTTIDVGGTAGNVSRSDVTWGIGGQYNFTPAWGIRLDYDSYGVSDSTQTATTSLASLGVVYKF